MITKEDIDIVIENPNKLKELDSEIKTLRARCDSGSKNIFDYYLFRRYINKKCMQKCETLKELTKMFDEKKIYPIKMNKFLREKIESYSKKYNMMKDKRKEYWRLHKEYGRALQRVIERTNDMMEEIENKDERKRIKIIRDKYIIPIKFSEGTWTPSSGEEKVMRVLEMIATQKELYYFYEHKWDYCRNANPLEYDFYCVLIYNGYFYHWVIEFDGDQHYYDTGFYNHTSDHRRDILKQYYLRELNIHLLRVRESSFNEIWKKIIKFINKIITCDNYMAVDYIIPNIKLLDNIKHPGMIWFNEQILDKIWVIKHNDMPEFKEKIRVSRKMVCNGDTDEDTNEYSMDETSSEQNKSGFLFVSNELKIKYGFMEEEFDEQEVLDFVYDRIDKMKSSKVVDKRSKNYDKIRGVIELFMYVDKYNTRFIDDL